MFPIMHEEATSSVDTGHRPEITSVLVCYRRRTDSHISIEIGKMPYGGTNGSENTDNQNDASDTWCRALHRDDGGNYRALLLACR